MARPRITRSQRLLTTLAPYEQVFVVTHDNPDPDAIASGWAVYTLLQEKSDRPVRLLGGGEIVRAENRHMIRLLEPPLELVNDFPLPDKTAIVLVDCGSESQNHLFRDSHTKAVAVIDHHLVERRCCRTAFEDIRPNTAASATIAGSYLREQGIEPKADLATGILYAIRTETRGVEVHYSRMDRTILLWLTHHANPSVLAQIENAPLSPEYFADLALALQGTFIYGDTALCLLPRASGPEIVGEVADLLIRCEGIRRVLCGAVVHEDLLLSVRTARDSNEDAAALVRDTLKGIGFGGGHRHRAGGKIPGSGRGPMMLDLLQDELLSRWLITCGIDRHPGQYLIGRQEIVENL